MLPSKIIGNEIEQLEKQIAPISSQLDEKIVAFSTVLPKAVEEWMNAEIKRRIEENSDLVTTAGVDTLRQMKAELSKLISRLPEICTNAIGDGNIWPHKPQNTAHRQQTSKITESYFASVFRNSISHLGTLLNKYGLLKVPTGHIATWERTTGEQFRYCINPGFDERNFLMVVEYNDLRKKHKALTEEIEKKQQALARTKASELWDNA